MGLSKETSATKKNKHGGVNVSLYLHDATPTAYTECHLIISPNKVSVYMHIGFISIRSTLIYTNSKRWNLNSAWLCENKSWWQQISQTEMINNTADTFIMTCHIVHYIASLLLLSYWNAYVKCVCMCDEWERDRKSSVQKIGYPQGQCLLPEERPVLNKSFHFHAQLPYLSLIQCGREWRKIGE